LIEIVRKINESAVTNQIIEDWSAKIVENATIDDLSPFAIKLAREKYAIKNNHLSVEINKWDNITFLNKARITINGLITNTAIILLGKPESNHFISPGTSQITWMLKSKENVVKDYFHFYCPLLENVDKVYSKIRNLKYRYIKDESLFPEEVDQYHPYIIREALNNCIAHKDYLLGGKIIVVEREDGQLSFTNLGDFIPDSIENVINANSPTSVYRNKLLCDAMVSLNMIDTVGSGIIKMFNIQREKFFPLPDYVIKNKKVELTIIGKVLDMNFARKLAQLSELTLQEIVLLDKVAKRKKLSKNVVLILKNKKLIEGRKPNYFIASKVANIAEERGKYIKNRGFKDSHYKKLILEYINNYGSASRADITKLIYGLLPDILDEEKKNNKIRNLIYSMSKRDESITNAGTKRNSIWVST